jgi:hypothetical protein
MEILDETFPGWVQATAERALIATLSTGQVGLGVPSFDWLPHSFQIKEAQLG